MKSKTGKYVLIGLGMPRKRSLAETTESIIKITPGYSPLEKYGNAELTQAADIYSLCAVGYNLLTSKSPKEAPKLLEDGFASMEDELKNKGVAIDFIKVVKTGMSNRIVNRYQTAKSLSLALSGIKLGDNINLKQNAETPMTTSPDYGETSMSGHRKPLRNRVISLIFLSLDGIPGNWAITLITLCLGMFAIFICMQAFDGGLRYCYDAFDSNSFGLSVLFILSLVLLGNLIFNRILKWKESWIKIIKNGMILIFIINTLLIWVWDPSLKIPFAILSFGLLTDVVIFLLLDKK